MSTLEMTTAERLLAVADIIEQHPERWDQESWVSGDRTLRAHAGLGSECGSVCCVAGWAVAMSPPDLFDHDAIADDGWTSAGAIALGLADNLVHVNNPDGCDVYMGVVR